MRIKELIEEVNSVEYTNGIPVCPYCRTPTKRQCISSQRTLVDYPPVFDEEGCNVNPDRNTITEIWHCMKCGKNYVVIGNLVDGFVYKKIEGGDFVEMGILFDR